MANRQSFRKGTVLEEIQGYCPEKRGQPAFMGLKRKVTSKCMLCRLFKKSRGISKKGYSYVTTSGHYKNLAVTYSLKRYAEKTIELKYYDSYKKRRRDFLFFIEDIMWRKQL